MNKYITVPSGGHLHLVKYIHRIIFSIEERRQRKAQETAMQAASKNDDNGDDLFNSSDLDVDLSALETFGQGAQLDGNDTDTDSDSNLVIDEHEDQVDDSPTRKSPR